APLQDIVSPHIYLPGDAPDASRFLHPTGGPALPHLIPSSGPRGPRPADACRPLRGCPRSSAPAFPALISAQATKGVRDDSTDIPGSATHDGRACAGGRHCPIPAAPPHAP